MKNYWKYILSGLVFVALYLFWAIPYRAALNYQEEFQLFLIDWDYFLTHLTTKGGLAVWTSELLVQFYNNYWIGAAVLAAELMLVQYLAWQNIRLMVGTPKPWHYLCSFLPTALLMIAIGDINVMHSLVVAVIFALMLTWLFLYIINKVGLVGNYAVTYSFYTIIFVLFVAIWTALAGTNHFRVASEGFTFSNVYNRSAYNQLDYDLLVRTGNWHAIIEKSEQHQPDVLMTVCATNLALGMTGQLGEKGNKFHQHGTGGLTPPFLRESFSTLTSAEVYYQLGLINTAQRFYFEAMEGLPNYKKSCRCVKRLAETNLINAQYEVARKYLRLLRKTACYRQWAEKMLKLTDGGDMAVAVHPFYGKMQVMRLDEDFLFSENDMDRILGKLFLKNPSNALATQYLLFYPLLENDMNKFEQYMQVVGERSYNAETSSFKKYLRKKQ